MFFWFALALGCGGDVAISYYAENCSDWEFDEEGENHALEVSVDEGVILFRRAGVSRACDASFQPEIVAQRKLVQVFELWEENDESAACTTCFTPTVTLSGLPRGTYELQWFEGESSTLPIGELVLSIPVESE